MAGQRGSVSSSEPNNTSRRVGFLLRTPRRPTRCCVAAVWLLCSTTSWRSLGGSRGFEKGFLGYRPPKWGARKYYLLLHQPESGRCRLQVILLDLTIREKSATGSDSAADLGGSSSSSEPNNTRRRVGFLLRTPRRPTRCCVAAVWLLCNTTS